ncbi:D-lactate dehydrogenase [cytochrome], mitochondrial 3 [Colletotrichum chlorophyti]|uniref:D-lactate dehydrogenase (cytochrome) n=1 Tax=Colletotrichum chlorophyti TaxID=708187 RepID=A0A1Q8S8G0_9PEZI|nr:D-lactate dehydrogenase [cytochrome], mitochondrial 3 [Colletotrichum chlorophyti]
MAFRAALRPGPRLPSRDGLCSRALGRPVCRVPSSRSNASRTGFRSVHTAPPTTNSRFIPLQLLVLGVIPLLAGYLIGRSGASGPGVTIERKLSQVDFASREQMLQAAREISQAVGEEAVSFDEDTIEQHGHSDWSTSNSSGRAVAIVYPRTTDEVSQVAKICNKYNVPMVPFGAGSSVEGSFSSPYSGICIDFVHMDKIIAFHPDEYMDVVVQPGINWVTLNKTIQSSGLFLPLDPSPTAMIGGMVSTNCSGTNAFRYGTMKDWVINLTVVLADGRVIKTRRRPRKNSAGYNLTSLFVGAEGTLGIVTEVTLKLAVTPQDTSVAVVSFPTIDDAARAATKLIRSGIQLGALEFMDEVQMQVINRHGSAAVRKTAWDESPTLFLKFSGTVDGIKGDVSRVKGIVQPYNPTKIFFARDKKEEADLWAARKEALWTMTSIKPKGHALWSTDVAVPISRLAEIISLSKEDSGKLGLFASVIGHVGDGNFHQAVMYDPKNQGQKASVAKCVHDMMGRALEMEGTVSDCLIDELGVEAIDFMKTLKQAVDPKWILNPGKVFDLPQGSKASAAP